MQAVIPQQAKHFRVRHKASDTTVDLFTITDNIQQQVQAKRDEFGTSHEVINVSKSRYQDLLNQKSPLRLEPQEA